MSKMQWFNMYLPSAEKREMSSFQNVQVKICSYLFSEEPTTFNSESRTEKKKKTFDILRFDVTDMKKQALSKRSLKTNVNLTEI